MQPPQQLLVDRMPAALQRVAAATDAEAFADAVDHQPVLMADAKPCLEAKQALLQRGVAAAVSAALATGLRILLRTQLGSTSSEAHCRFRDALDTMYGWLHTWISVCGGPGTSEAGQFARDVSTDDLTALVAPACRHLTQQLQQLQEQHSREQEQQQQLQHQQRRQHTSLGTGDTLLHSIALGDMLVTGHKRLASAQGIAAHQSCGIAAGPLPKQHRAAAAQLLVVVSPLAAATLRSYFQMQASSSTSGLRSARLAARLEPDMASLSEAILSLFMGPMCGTGPGDEQLPYLVRAAPDLSWLLAVNLAIVCAAAHARAGGAPRALPAAVGGSSSGGGASSTRNSRQQGHMVPPHHVQLLQALGVPAGLAAHVRSDLTGTHLHGVLLGLSTHVHVAVLEAAPAAEARSSSSSSSSRGSHPGQHPLSFRSAGQAAAHRASLAALSMLRLSMQQLACICAAAAEALALLPTAHMARVPLLLESCHWLVTNSSSGGQAAADADTSDAASGSAPGVAAVPDVLTLVVQLLMPAAMHLAAQAPDPAAARREAWVGIKRVFQATVAGGNVFDGPAFQRHPTAVLAAFEAVMRVLAADDPSDGPGARPFIFLVQEYATSSSTLSAHLAAAATDPGPARALLSLLASCAKAVAADWSCQAAGSVEAAAQGVAMSGAATALSVALTAQHALRSIIEGSEPSSSSSSTDLQPLVWGFGHVMGKALHTAGAVLSAVLPEQPPNNSSEEAVEVAAALPCKWDKILLEYPLQKACWLLLHALQSGKQLLPTGCAGWTQEQLLERFSTLESAIKAVLSLCARLADGAREAEAVLAASDIRQGHVVILAHNAQVQLLLCTQAEGRRLADALTSLGAALCGALPTRFACNDPACAACDQLSEQQLVSGKGSVCSGCRVARFCCVEHHRRSSKAHKAACRALAAAADAAASGSGAGSSSGGAAAGVSSGNSSSGGKGKGKAKGKRAQA